MASAGPYATCISLQTDNHATPAPHHCFLQAVCPSRRPTNSVKALKAVIWLYLRLNLTVIRLFIKPFNKPSKLMCRLSTGGSFSWIQAQQYWQTHTRIYRPFVRTIPGWAGTRKVKPIWILLKQETVSGSGISWAECKSAPCSRQKTTPAPYHSDFYRPDALPAAQPTESKHWRQLSTILTKMVAIHNTQFKLKLKQ